MQVSLLLACLWIVVASVIAMIPSRRSHWPQAYVLIAVGVPLVVWVWAEAGVLMAAAFLVAGGSILRWPVRHLLRWVRRRVGGGQSQ